MWEWIVIVLCLAVLAYLGWCEWAPPRCYPWKGTSAAPQGNRRSTISKKDAEYARFMHRLEDERDDLEAVDLGEAYNFHYDCGDR